MCSRQGKFELMSVNHNARSGGKIVIFFSIFFHMHVCCVFTLESPHRGDSNKHTQHTIINIKTKITLNYSKYNNGCSYGIRFLRIQERVRNSRGKRAISVRANEVLLFFPVLRKLFYGIIVQRIAIILVLIEHKMNCPSNTFVSYRLFIVYRNSVLKLNVRVLVTFFTTSP